ncbi:MAG: 2-oxo acid dehydrogenase subunit E2 [Opitutales bacterium]|nr:2-oxo acid dehydrogenase subunit E2 [Opitutales bacterium]
MPALSKKDKQELLRIMLLSRFGDLREQSLIRQGRGWFHVSGMGHEALAVAGRLMEDGDYFAGYYRDRPIALGRGVSPAELARSFFAKAEGASGGRQMPAHYSSRELGIFSIASVVASSLLPACGLAWGLQLDNSPHCVVTTVGDAGTRQGDFFETVALAREMNLPLVVLVEDNGIGISSRTEKIHPLALGVMDAALWEVIDGCDVASVHTAMERAMAKARKGGGPSFIWARCERISSHSSADDQRKYRAESELEGLATKDPVTRFKETLVEEGVYTDEEIESLEKSIEAEVRAQYDEAWSAPDPDPATLLNHVFGQAGSDIPAPAIGGKTRMVDAINQTFHAILEEEPGAVFFGQDIEDPKGGVFSLTKGLSTAAPGRVRNSPLAESTIIGVAVGLAAYGKRPVFEIQFTDYLWAGFNHIATHLSTLLWRSNGEWPVPAVIYAPYGAYLPGGALWHSQANEGALAHFPGIQIAIPSTPEDAAGLFWSAVKGQSPTLILVPKHIMWKAQEARGSSAPVPFGEARFVRRGEALTLVTWGNCVEVVDDALASLPPNYSVEVIDLRTVVPLDWSAVESSVRKTGRLLVVQEDAISCSVGQNIVSRISGNESLFGHLLAPPRLLAKPDVNVGYHPNLEYASLPSAESVAKAVRDLLTHSGARVEVRAAVESIESAAVASTPCPQPVPASASTMSANHLEDIRVPLLGEGIASARVIALLVKPGEPVEPDKALCEVETDKALFPIETSLEGTLVEWLVADEDEVEVDQIIARVRVDRPGEPPVAAHRAAAKSTAPIAPDPRPTEGGLAPRIVAQLKNVVPAHMTVKARWQALRQARSLAKKQMGADAPSPTVMIAWSLVRAMTKHPVFSCTITGQDTLLKHAEFDFGVAVALENDALDTAVIHRANALDWPAFMQAYQDAVKRVREGQSSSKAGTPLILTSMGGFGVRDALPVVVPPAIGTLFVGESHMDSTSAGEHEVVSLCLSFDHRWINGVAGAQFLADVRKEMENFALPGAD